MPTQTTHPRIASVKPLTAKRLLVRFRNGVTELYDCAPLLAHEVFAALKDDALFRCAHADPHGYAVLWNDDIDLAESELWISGQTVESPEKEK